ncbi:MAG TPA: dTMP kinase [Gemmatimonadales bacterium]|nr:dTMP kinase [Gemmatimonadales bacterium]
MASGLFIAFEGVEGAGKTTQVALFAERCRAAGLDVVVVREPGGTGFAEKCRDLLLHAPQDLTAASELFLFNAARADLVARVIGPALAAGRIVVADRYELSSRAYQVAGRGLRESLVRAVISLAVDGIRPDAYVVLDVAPRVGRARQDQAGKVPDRIEREDAKFHSRVYRAFRNAKGPGIIHVKASGEAGAVADAVWKALARRFPGRLRVRQRSP